MKIKAFVFVLLVCIGISIAASANDGFMSYCRNGYSYQYSEPEIIVDNETGVNYILITKDGGFGSVSVAICPRYRADGTLWVDDEY